MSALPSLATFAFEDTVHVGLKKLASPKPAAIIRRPGPKPSLESAFRRWDAEGGLDETRVGSPLEQVSFQVFPPVRAREAITLRRLAAERPRRGRKWWLDAMAVVVGAFFVLLAVAAIFTAREDAAPLPRVAVPVPVPVDIATTPAVAAPEDAIPGLIAPPPPAPEPAPPKKALRNKVARK